MQSEQGWQTLSMKKRGKSSMNVDLGKGKLPAINSPTVSRNNMNQTSLFIKNIRT